MYLYHTSNSKKGLSNCSQEEIFVRSVKSVKYCPHVRTKRSSVTSGNISQAAWRQQRLACCAGCCCRGKYIQLFSCICLHACCEPRVTYSVLATDFATRFRLSGATWIFLNICFLCCMMSCVLVHWYSTFFFCGKLVVKALSYKPEGRGFESRWDEILNLPKLSGRTRLWGLLSL
jgi:hypothetical protein